MCWFTSFALILVAFSGCFAFPNDIVKCKMSDEKCLVESANYVLRKYYAGLDEINLTPLDPFFIEYARVIERAGPVTVDSKTNNSYITGFRKGIVQSMKGFDKNLLEIKIKAQRLDFNGTYKAQSHVFGIPINGGGPYKVTFDDFTSKISINFTRIQKEGKQHFKIVNAWMHFEIDDGEVDVPDIGFLLNAFVNASFNLIKNALTPAVSEIWVKIFMEQFSELFEKLPISELFLD